MNIIKTTKTCFLHIFIMYGHEQRERVMQLYTEFKSFFFKKRKIKKEKIALSFTIPLEIKPSRINDNNNHSSN